VLARRHRTTVLAGRTHGQQAAPITFGFKVAGWIDEGARHLERMETAAEGAFQAMLGGAVGNFASFGAIGPELQRVFAQKLELGVMLHPSRSVFDALAAYGLALSLAAGTLARSARDQYEMMKSEIGELFPDDGSIGSSTMPQKRNPATNTRSLRCWSRIRSRVPLLLESLAGEYEAQPPNDDLLAEALTDIARDLRSLIDLQRSSMATLVVDERRMLRNIQDAGGWILAESLMFTLAGELGRMRAHDLLHELALDARRKGLAIQDAVAEHPGLQEILKGRPVAELFDPARHVGLCPQLVDEALARACL
jgi:adenylosuccinate lyase